jgi:uncharacterized protein
MEASAANIVLVGDQMQLPQPVQGVHPGENGLSSLEYLLEGHRARGAWHPSERDAPPASRALRPISEAIYDGRLEAHPMTAKRQLVLRPGASAALGLAGLSFVPVAHDACTQSSRGEAEAIACLAAEL